MTFKVNELEGMKRGELQKLCKSVGIKANSKVCPFQSSRAIHNKECSSCESPLVYAKL